MKPGSPRSRLVIGLALADDGVAGQGHPGVGLAPGAAEALLPLLPDLEGRGTLQLAIRAPTPEDGRRDRAEASGSPARLSFGGQAESGQSERIGHRFVLFL